MIVLLGFTARGVCVPAAKFVDCFEFDLFDSCCTEFVWQPLSRIS